LLEINLKYIFGILIYSLKHIQSFKYEKHLQEYDMKLQNISYTQIQLLVMDVTVIGHLHIFSNIVKYIYNMYPEPFLVLQCS